MTSDELAQEIRRVDGENSLGAGALAEALMPFLSRTPAPEGEVVAWRYRFVTTTDGKSWSDWYYVDTQADIPPPRTRQVEHRLYASPVVSVGVGKDQEATVVNALIAFANAVEGQSRSRRIALACEHTKALVAALGTTDQGSRSKASVPTEGGQAVAARYRKTATIEAVQWFKMGDHPDVILKSAPNRYADEGVPWCPTLEGGHVVTPGDWIATGAEGEHWPIKPDIFAKTYVLATPASPIPGGDEPSSANEPDPSGDTGREG